MLVLQTDNTILYDRLVKRCARPARQYAHCLWRVRARSFTSWTRQPRALPRRHTRRGYSVNKVQENVECEIMMVVQEEARESYR